VARFVLLQFDDDQEAENFVSDAFFPQRMSPLLQNFGYMTAKCWGVYQKPTRFCDCDGSGKKTMIGFTRGKKYGWWIHAKCMKPTAKWASGRQWFTVLGANLLPRSLRPYPEEMPERLESPAVLNGLLPKEENQGEES
jgi:hypothetical protein